MQLKIHDSLYEFKTTNDIKEIAEKTDSPHIMSYAPKACSIISPNIREIAEHTWKTIQLYTTPFGQCIETDIDLSKEEGSKYCQYLRPSSIIVALDIGGVKNREDFHDRIGHFGLYAEINTEPEKFNEPWWKYVCDRRDPWQYFLFPAIVYDGNGNQTPFRLAQTRDARTSVLDRNIYLFDIYHMKPGTRVFNMHSECYYQGLVITANWG